jgi:hypothetical protein
MSKVWVVGDDQLEWIAEREPLKVFKEKNDALDYYNSRHISEVSMVEAELVWVVPPTFPLPASEYICMKCGEYRPNWFKLCWQDNLFNNDKAWCETCKEDTGYRKIHKKGIGPYCLIEPNCSKCGKEMHDRSEPITDGAQDITYVCEECAKNMNGYVQILVHPTKSRIAPASPMTDELWAKFSAPREEEK